MVNVFPRELIKHFKNEETRTVMVAHDAPYESLA